MTVTDIYEIREIRQRAEAEHNAQEHAEQIRGALDGELYIHNEDGELFTSAAGDGRIDAGCSDPVDFIEWLNFQLEVDCLYNKDGEPQQVTVLMSYGGPTCRTHGDYVIWSHGTHTARAWVEGLHDALLELHEPLALADRW